MGQVSINQAAQHLGIVWDKDSDLRYENSTSLGIGKIYSLPADDDGRPFGVALLPHRYCIFAPSQVLYIAGRTFLPRTLFGQEGSKLACGRESDRMQSARANFYDRRQRPEYLVHPGRSFPPLHSAHVSGDAISVFSVCTSPMQISVLANELLTHRGPSLSSLGLLVNPHSRPLSAAAAQHVHKALQPHGHYGRDDGGSLLLRREEGGRQDVVDGKD